MNFNSQLAGDEDDSSDDNGTEENAWLEHGEIAVSWHFFYELFTKLSVIGI